MKTHNEFVLLPVLSLCLFAPAMAMDLSSSNLPHKTTKLITLQQATQTALDKAGRLIKTGYDLSEKNGQPDIAITTLKNYRKKLPLALQQSDQAILARLRENEREQQQTQAKIAAIKDHLAKRQDAQIGTEVLKMLGLPTSDRSTDPTQPESVLGKRNLQISSPTPDSSLLDEESARAMDFVENLPLPCSKPWTPATPPAHATSPKSTPDFSARVSAVDLSKLEQTNLASEFSNFSKKPSSAAYFAQFCPPTSEN